MPSGHRQARRDRKAVNLALAGLQPRAWPHLRDLWRGQQGRCGRCGDPFPKAPHEPAQVSPCPESTVYFFEPGLRRMLVCTPCMRGQATPTPAHPTTGGPTTSGAGS